MGISPTGGVDWFWPFAGACLLSLVFICITIYLANKLKKMQRFAWLVDVMAECENGSMGILVDRGGKLLPFAIEHDPKNEGLLKNKRYTLLHPDLAKPNTKHKLKGGPETSFYPLPGYFPYSIQSAAALVQLAQDLREDPRFSWITDELDLIALMFNSTESFPRDARQLVKDSVSFGDEVPEGYLDDDDEFQEDEDEFSEDEDDDLTEEDGFMDDDPTGDDVK